MRERVERGPAHPAGGEALEPEPDQRELLYERVQKTRL
jgi:hypothetical protein